MKERIQKILSQWGVASRRQAENMIQEGRVTVNGRIVHLGDKADTREDRLEIDGIALKNRPKLIYVLLHKPIGVVSTCHDPQHRATVLDLLPEKLRIGQGIHPVGRLDFNSTGALLLTNDGNLTVNLTHPRYHLPKTYQVLLQGELSASMLQNWRKGMNLDGQKTLPAQIKVLRKYHQESLLEIILTEGRNRQIRRVAEQLGLKVRSLHRTAIGFIQLNKPLLRSGNYRFLTDDEISLLQKKYCLSIPV